MQGLPAKGGQSGLCGWRQAGRFGAEAGAVVGVAEQRMPDVRHMHPDLVGSAGFEPAFDQAGDRLTVSAGIALQHLPMCDGFAAAFAYRAFVAGLRMTIERRVDGAFGTARGAPYKREVAALELSGTAVIGEL